MNLRTLLIVAAVAVVAAIAWVQMPASWTSMSLGPSAVMLSAANPIVLRPGAAIIVEGDSLIYGQDTRPDDGPHLKPINGAATERNATPIPEALAIDLKGAAHVDNHGYPGDRTSEALPRWADSDPSDLAILMYGTNDFGNYGKFPDGPNSLSMYKKQLTQLVDRRKKQGARVVLMDLPPLEDRDSDRNLEPYRTAERQVSVATGSLFFETRAPLENVKDKWVDGLHLSAASCQAIADALAASIQISPPPP